MFSGTTKIMESSNLG